MTDHQTQFLFTVFTDELEPVTWKAPTDLDQIEETEDAMLNVVVIDAATWRSEGVWDDRDPFEMVSRQLGLARCAECIYEPDVGTTVSAAVSRLLADPRFLRDDSI